MMDCPGGGRLGQWVQQQVDGAVEFAVRDVRSVAEAQARLLRVVENISEELNGLQRTVSSCSSACGGFATLEQVRVETQGGLKAHALATQSALAQAQAQAHSQAQHLQRIDKDIWEMRQQLHVALGHSADVSQLKAIHHEAITNHSAALDQVRQVQTNECRALAAQVAKLDAVVGELRQHHGEHRTQLQKQHAEICQHRGEDASRHAALVGELQLLRSIAAKASQLESEITELKRHQAEDSTRREEAFLEFNKRVHGGSNCTDLLARLSRIDDQVADYGRQLGEERTKLKNVLCDIKQLGVELARHQVVIGGDLQALRSSVELHDSAVAQLERQARSAPRSHSPEAMRSLRETLEQRLREGLEQHAANINQHAARLAKLEVLQSESPETLQRLQQTLEKQRESLDQNEANLEQHVARVAQLALEGSQTQRLHQSLDQKLREGLELHSARLAQLQDCKSPEFAQRLHGLEQQMHQSAEQHSARLAEIEGQLRRATTMSTSIAEPTALPPQLEVALREDLSAMHQQLAVQLQTETRGAMQSLAAAIKALDEQLWHMDEQLWQTDKRLEARIDQVAQRTAFATAVEREALLAGQQLGGVLERKSGSFLPPAFINGADELASCSTAGEGSLGRHANDPNTCQPQQPLSKSPTPATTAATPAALTTASAGAAAVGYASTLAQSRPVSTVACPLPPPQAGVRRDLDASFSQTVSAELTVNGVRGLRISFLKAIGLKHLNIVGDAPWCVCEVRRSDGSGARASCQTQALQHTVEPVWNETHQVEWFAGETVDFALYDTGVAGSKVGGRVSVPSSRFFPGGFEGPLPLSGLPEAALYVRIIPLTAAVEPQAPMSVAADRAALVEAQPPSRGNDVCLPAITPSVGKSTGETVAPLGNLLKGLGSSPIACFLAAGDAFIDGARLGSPFSPSSCEAEM